MNGESVTFPVRLEAGWYLEYSGGEAVFDANGFTKTETAPEGQFPVLGTEPTRSGFPPTSAKDPAKITVI